MHPDYEYNRELHQTATEMAHDLLTRICGQKTPTRTEEKLSRAYLDLLERRGMPPTLKCYPSIQLKSGVFYDFVDPESSPISPEDIAAGLSKIARCTGHTLGYEPYTVAQHCCYASDMAEPQFKFEALMHDAPESVLGDIATPLKQILVDYQRIEDRVTTAFSKQFRLPEDMSPEVKKIDIRMAATEKRDIMPAGEWEMLRGVEPFDFKIEPWSHRDAYGEWLSRFYHLHWERVGVYG